MMPKNVFYPFNATSVSVTAECFLTNWIATNYWSNGDHHCYVGNSTNMLMRWLPHPCRNAKCFRSFRNHMECILKLLCPSVCNERTPRNSEQISIKINIGKFYQNALTLQSWLKSEESIGHSAWRLLTFLLVSSVQLGSCVILTLPLKIVRAVKSLNRCCPVALNYVLYIRVHMDRLDKPYVNTPPTTESKMHHREIVT